MAITAKVPHYRKTKSGEWVVCGPADVVQAGAAVTVHKKDGTTKVETIERVGKPFELDGIQCCYGYLRRDSGGSGRKGQRVREGTRTCWETGGRCYSTDGSPYCDECGEYIYASSRSRWKESDRDPEVQERRKLLAWAGWD